MFTAGASRIPTDTAVCKCSASPRTQTAGRGNLKACEDILGGMIDKVWLLPQDLAFSRGAKLANGQRANGRNMSP